MSNSFTIPSKKEAWAARPDETVLPLNRGGKRFRRNWFRYRNCCTFSTFLPNRFPADRPWNMLTIGVFEGAQEVWLMQHILKHPDSRLVGVDPWMGSQMDKSKMDQTFMDECYDNAQHNLAPWKDQVTLVCDLSQVALQRAIEAGEIAGIPVGQFDLVIIDGDHNEVPVLIDAVNSFQLVRSGGWLLFDDVRNRIFKPHHVLHALHKFLDQYGDQLQHVWSHRFCECFERV